jgi:2,4-dienoyl-CoA reductase (NADPH2)
MYPHLFSPITINSLVVRNRIAYPSLGLLYSYDTRLNDRYRHFYDQIPRGGAGVAGLEAAITAKQAGHSVEIYEKAGEIGGQIWIAAAPPHKQELLEFIRYYGAMVKKFEIPVYLNTCVDLALIETVRPDQLIIAQGAAPLIPPIDGVHDPCVRCAWQVLRENPCLGKNVAVIGGGAVGLETVLFVASKGTLSPEMLHFLVTYEALEMERIRHYMFNGTSRVTVFEMLEKAGPDVGKSTRWILMNNLACYGVKILTRSTVGAIKDGVVRYEREGGEGKV